MNKFWICLVFIVLVVLVVGKDKNPDNSNDKKFTHVLLEKGASVSKSLEENPDSLYEIVRIIKSYGYKCNSISGAYLKSFSKGVNVFCNDFYYQYLLENRGGNWVVKPK